MTTSFDKSGEQVRASIHRLSDHVVDLIAAGEVVERPAAALKELVENALDAGATRIEVDLWGGGCESIEVTDNGSGIAPDELALAVERHCTSKLNDNQLVHIRTLGFRGEALPSIGASARLSLISRLKGAETAWSITVEGGVKSEPMPSAGEEGTIVIVRDLFFATPARRKFLKSARVEGSHAEMVMRRVALSAPHCAILFRSEGRDVFNLPPQDLKDRVAFILNVPSDSLLTLDEQRGAMRLTGFLCNPGHTRPTGAGQFILVNDRPVIDPVLRTAVRVGYRSVIERGRFPILFLHLHVPFERVDVNVHPAKTELRFADEAEVRAFVIGAIGRVLTRGASQVGGIEADITHFTTQTLPSTSTHTRPAHFGVSASASSTPQKKISSSENNKADLGFSPSVRRFPEESVQDLGGFAESQKSYTTPQDSLREELESVEFEQEDYPSQPLGVPIGQIHTTYILSVAPNGDLILTDQHAAHERLTHERLRKRFEEGRISAQVLLLPEVLDLSKSEREALLVCQEELSRLGLEIEAFGEGSLLIRTIPAPLKGGDVTALIRDIAEELIEEGASSARQTDSLDQRFEAIMARMACHGSIRAGRKLNFEEMGALLRDMEQHPRSNTCPHGRPTWLRLTKDALEKMFGRVK
ncbi:DNA mismatch repair endonuclease MutL [Aristophania vespae]|uniref:DNA mismatch repair endonuclease MutL n=1 Tax=Aristophania vespae TaxID=2697033 RepID=UPI0023512525|nr:DNA mismatch repair endonuclease MutL [Aristophania vespae]UMM64140.1 DNA mismatch repair protein MutL [Aristophania vespae]